jgi:cellulose synthase/poly-beta-1,6-N-acetylglucosamine synthase-like glycosyltransferase
MITSILPFLVIDGVESAIRKRRSSSYKFKPLEFYEENYDFTIIIPAYNAERTIEKTLKHLEKYRERTIVVDDGSKDETVKIARSFGFEVIRNETNERKIGAIKLGLENVSSTYTVLLDADSYPERPELLPNLIQALYDENLIAAGAQVLPENPNKIIEKLQYIEYKIAMEIGRRSMAKNKRNICISGAFGAYRTRELREITEIQLKDPHFEGEDFERTLYLLEKGNVGYFSDFIVRTVVPKSLKDLTIQRIRWQYGYLRVHIEFYNMLKRKDEVGLTLWYNWILNIGLHPLKLISLPFLLYYDLLSFPLLYAGYYLLAYSLFSSSSISEEEKKLFRKYLLIYPLYSLYNLAIPTTIGYIRYLKRITKVRK